MKDSELRGIVLDVFYRRRREGGFISLQKEDFDDVPQHLEWPDIYRVCDQLEQHGLIQWKPIRAAGGIVVTGMGQITANGVDVKEGETTPPISINFDHSIKVSGSSNVQIGNGNVQEIQVHLQTLISKIDESSGSEEEKKDAKSLLRRFVEHPLVSSVAGGLAGGINW